MRGTGHSGVRPGSKADPGPSEWGTHVPPLLGKPGPVLTKALSPHSSHLVWLIWSAFSPFNFFFGRFEMRISFLL